VTSRPASFGGPSSPKTHEEQINGASRSCRRRRRSPPHNPARRFILQDGADRKVYLDLLQQSAELHGIALIGYCLVSNHVHLVAVPRKTDVLARALQEAHGRFVPTGTHSPLDRTCLAGPVLFLPLDEPHSWKALRYTELNPVRASLVARAECWDWSSATAHCGADSTGARLATHSRRRRWSAVTYRAYLNADVTESQLATIRRSTYRGRPLGSHEFTRTLEKKPSAACSRKSAGPRRGSIGKPRDGNLGTERTFLPRR
jgi:putative transposase